MPGDIKKGLEAGFFRYLTKPIKVNEFMDALDMARELAETVDALDMARELAETVFDGAVMPGSL